MDTGASLIHSRINSLYASGGTNIGAGIQAGGSTLVPGTPPDTRQKMMVVLSDGVTSYSGYATERAAYYYNTYGIVTHTVGVPGHDYSQMSAIASAGHGTYNNVTNLNTLIGIFDGTGGNLVGLDHIDIQLPDGSMLLDWATDGLGNFTLPNWTMALGPNIFTVNAYGTDGTSATAYLTLYGTVVQVPGAFLIGSIGLAFSGWRLRRRKEA